MKDSQNIVGHVEDGPYLCNIVNFSKLNKGLNRELNVLVFVGYRGMGLYLCKKDAR